ncbi:unnamed protein product [Urochloa humidicola]
MQILLTMAAMGGRDWHYGCCPASPDGSIPVWSARSITKYRPASPSPICGPVSSHGGGGGRRDDREPHGGNDASSFVTPQMVSSCVLPSRCLFVLPAITFPSPPSPLSPSSRSNRVPTPPIRATTPSSVLSLFDALPSSPRRPALPDGARASTDATASAGFGGCDGGCDGRCELQRMRRRAMVGTDATTGDGSAAPRNPDLTRLLGSAAPRNPDLTRLPLPLSVRSGEVG